MPSLSDGFIKNLFRHCDPAVSQPHESQDIDIAELIFSDSENSSSISTAVQTATGPGEKANGNQPNWT
jgi:hypothetical protein